jgi:hypothetical protein
LSHSVLYIGSLHERDDSGNEVLPDEHLNQLTGLSVVVVGVGFELGHVVEQEIEQKAQNGVGNGLEVSNVSQLTTITQHSIAKVSIQAV